jgi:glycosyltransferase involved in cell wall biosynthesis
MTLTSPATVPTTRALALVPAHNEAANLPTVIARVREERPDLSLLVVDDGSTDETASVLRGLSVRRLHWPERRGVGSALRAGIKYAARLGFDVIVRVDADGQHDARDIETVLAPVRAGHADAVFGSRYAGGRTVGIKRLLAALVSLGSRRQVTDATSGFWALGPRAVQLLADHHPRGYPEPELHLLLSRNDLRVVEVSIRDGARLHGRSTLTPARLVTAAARVALALVIVPLRQRISL